MMEKLGVEMDVKIMTNVLFSRSFNFDTVVRGLNISPHASIKMTKLKNMIFNSLFRSLFDLFESIFWKPFSWSFKNGITIEFSCKNDGEVDVKIMTNVLFSR